MTREQLDAIRARVEAATPGPWMVFGGGRDAADIVAENGTDICRVKRSYEPAKPNDADEAWANARLIENAPTDLRALLAEVERLTAEVESKVAQNVALIAELREARAELDFIKAEYADASTEDLTRDALLLRLRVQESANEGLRASVATLTADPLPAAAWVREVERAAFRRGVAAMRNAAMGACWHASAMAIYNRIGGLPDPEDK